MAVTAATTPITPHTTTGKTSDTGDQPTLENVIAVYSNQNTR